MRNEARVANLRALQTKYPKLSQYLAMAARDLRAVRPRAAADVAVWTEDVEHTIRCQEITGEVAEQFRRACEVAR